MNWPTSKASSILIRLSGTEEESPKTRHFASCRVRRLEQRLHGRYDKAQDATWGAAQGYLVEEG
jgi:hypothetical protein